MNECRISLFLFFYFQVYFEFTIGEAVWCRNGEGEFEKGVVKSINPLRVRKNGWFKSSQSWDEVKKLN